MGNIAGLRAGQVPPELGRVGYGDTPLPCTSQAPGRPGQLGPAQPALKLLLNHMEIFKKPQK